MLSKYQEKIKKRYEETESGRIAYAIYENREVLWNRYLYKDEEINLGNGVTAFQEGALSLVISKHVPDKGNRFWIKVLPSFENDLDKIIDILEAQQWYYF